VGALRPFRHISIILIAMFVFLVGCSNARNYEVATLTDKQRTKVQQILTAEQLKNLDDWINRNTMAGKGLPPRVTIEQALKEQDAWLAKQKIDEAKAEELRRSVQAERAAKQEEFARMLSVMLLSKKNKVQEDERRYVTLEIAYENKADKDIQGVKGVLKLTDIYGDPIIDINCSYYGGISAKQTAVEHDAGVSINRSMEPQVKLWNTDFEKLKSTFEVSTITFKDGTSINGPT
jgi:hypothetical protein